MMMKEMMNMPKNLCKEAKMAGKTTYLERQIFQKVKAGNSLTDIAMKYLPASDKAKVQADMVELEKGVYAVYEQKNVEMDAKSVEQYLNNALGNQKNDKCITHLTNINAIIEHLVDLAPEERITKEDAHKVEVIKQKQKADITDEDVAFVLGVTRQLLTNNAGVLAHKSVVALDDMMPYLTKEIVTEIADKGMDHAVAYGLACYIMQKDGENPWGMKENVGVQTPYETGVTAATNVEASKLLALYCKGKIRLRMLQDKLKQLFTMAFAFMCKYGYHLTMASAFILMYACGEGIWVSLLGAVVLTAFTKEAVDTINFFWSEIKVVRDIFFEKKEVKHVDETTVATVNESVSVIEEHSNAQDNFDSEDEFAF